MATLAMIHGILIVVGFIAAHQAELFANWESINSESGTFFKIEA